MALPGKPRERIDVPKTDRKIKFGLFMRPGGNHIAAWRLPDAPKDPHNNLEHIIDVAKTAERGLFDMLFWADTVGVEGDDPSALSRLARVAYIEPFTMLSALAMVTEHIGLVCTGTTTYEEPYNLARRFASLDKLSGGRAGWNLVTSASNVEAPNFGRDRHMPKAERYRRATEFADVVLGLWRSWDEDAFIQDKAAGRFFSPERMHVLNHVGEYFKVRGPLNVSRSEQGEPVLVQAGASDDGRNLAATKAEVIFTATNTIDEARAFYADVKERVAKAGRNPDDVKIMPGFSVLAAPTEAEAKAQLEQLQALIHPEVGLRHLSTYIHFDLRGYDVDGPLPEMPEDDLTISRRNILVDLAKRENLTIRQLYERISISRGHYNIVGSVQQAADVMEEWFTTGAADGFNLVPPTKPASLRSFVDLVVPELQRRGLYRTAYEGKTLRENLGLPRPVLKSATSEEPARMPAE